MATPTEVSKVQALMSLPPLQPSDSAHAFVRGDVRIHPSAAIAPGVLLQAEPGSCLIIGAGVCIGMGAVLHVYQGELEIEEGVNLGAGALIVGQGRIERGACIGSSATVFNQSIRRGEMIPPGALVGDTSRQQDELQAVDTVALPAPEPAPLEAALMPTTVVEPEAPPPELPAASGSVNVYGQMYVNQLMVKLLPNRRPNLQNQSGQLEPPPGEDPWDD